MCSLPSAFKLSGYENVREALLLPLNGLTIPEVSLLNLPSGEGEEEDCVGLAGSLVCSAISNKYPIELGLDYLYDIHKGDYERSLQNTKS